MQSLALSVLSTLIAGAPTTEPAEQVLPTAEQVQASLEKRAFHDLGGIHSGFAWSADETRMVCLEGVGSDECRLWEVNLLSGAQRLVCAGPSLRDCTRNLVGSVRWTEDGKHVVIASHHKMAVILVEDGTMVTARGEFDRGPCLLPDGEHMLIHGRRYDVQGDAPADFRKITIADLLDPGIRISCPKCEVGCWPPVTVRVSPDGSYLAWLSGSRLGVGRIEAIDQGFGTDVRSYPLEGKGYLAWFPDSRHILVSSMYSRSERDIAIFDAQTGDAKVLLLDRAPSLMMESLRITLSPDGGYAGIVEKTRTRRQRCFISVVSLRNATLAVGIGSGWGPGWTRWSPRGTFLVSAVSRRGSDASVRVLTRGSIAHLIADAEQAVKGNADNGHP